MKTAVHAALALVIVALLGGNVLQSRWLDAAALEHEEDRRLWNAQMDSTSEWARDSVQLAKTEWRQAKGALDAAFVLAGHAGAYTDTLRIEVERVRLVQVPDTCAAAVASRDSLIERGSVVAAGYEAAYRYQARATTRALRTASLYGLAYDSVSAALEARPRPRSRWLPRVVVGPYAGIDSNLRRSTGVAITAGWEINLERLLPWN